MLSPQRLVPVLAPALRRTACPSSEGRSQQGSRQAESGSPGCGIVTYRRAPDSAIPAAHREGLFASKGSLIRNDPQRTRRRRSAAPRKAWSHEFACIIWRRARRRKRQALIRRQSRKRAEARQSSSFALRQPIHEFANAARQRAARAALLGDSRPKPNPDVGTEPPLYLFHDKSSLQNHRRKTGGRGTQSRECLIDRGGSAVPWRISPPSTINSGAASCVRRAASQPLIVLAVVKEKAFDQLDINPAKLFPVGTHESVNRIAAGTIARCMQCSSNQLLKKS